VKVEKQSLEAELTELRAKYVPRGITSAHPLVADRAKGSELWDVNGRRFVDFAGGIGVMNVGHGHPKVLEAVKSQLDRATHVSFQVLMYESYLRLAQRLSDMAPGDGPKKAIFFSTGAEAVENAVKFARLHTKRSAVIAFDGGNDFRMLMAGIDHGNAGGEVDVALAVLAPDLGVLGALGVDGGRVSDAARHGRNSALMKVCRICHVDVPFPS